MNKTIINVRAASDKFNTMKIEGRKTLVCEFIDLIISSQSQIEKANQIDINELKSNNYRPEYIKKAMVTEDDFVQLKNEYKQLQSAVLSRKSSPEKRYLYNGTIVEMVRDPLGVIAILADNCPLMAMKCLLMALIAGNGCVLYYSKEIKNTIEAIFKSFEDHYKQYIKICLVEVFNNQESLMKIMSSCYFDLVIPFGTFEFIHFCEKNSASPIIKQNKGVIHILVGDKAAYLRMRNGCLKSVTSTANNRASTIVVCDNKKESFKEVVEELKKLGYAIYGCIRASKYYNIDEANSDNFSKNDVKSVNIVLPINFLEALNHIKNYTSGIIDVIISEDEAEKKVFHQTIKSAVVLENLPSTYATGRNVKGIFEFTYASSGLFACGPVTLVDLQKIRYIINGEMSE